MQPESVTKKKGATASTPKSSAKTEASKTTEKVLHAPNADSLKNVLYDKAGFLARRFQQICVSIFLDFLVDYDLTPLQFGVMSAVNVMPGIDQTRTAESLGLDRTTVLGIIDRLEKKNLIVRKTPPNNRRNRLLFLTSEGKKRLKAVQKVYPESQELMLDPLQGEERVMFKYLIQKIVDYHNENIRVPVDDSAKKKSRD